MINRRKQNDNFRDISWLLKIDSDGMARSGGNKPFICFGPGALWGEMCKRGADWKQSAPFMYGNSRRKIREITSDLDLAFEDKIGRTSEGDVGEGVIAGFLESDGEGIAALDIHFNGAFCTG